MRRGEFIAGLGSAVTWPSLALVATASGALVNLKSRHWRHEPPVEVRPASIAPAISPSSLDIRDQGFATAKAGQNNLAAVLAISPSSPGTGEPVFNIDHIEASGDAVIAGKAAPGASVELLRSGALHDRVVADQSGQFVMVPPRLPPGDYRIDIEVYAAGRHPGNVQTERGGRAPA